MAISATHYMLLRELRTQGVLPQGGDILEIGKANWYGDALPPDGIPADTPTFEIVARIYQQLMAPRTVTAIDMDPAAENAIRHDLNEPMPRPGMYETVINHGTAEHIFNIANVYRVMHDACKPGGLMIHESPFTGWVDHGFYCIQPTLFWDLAEANGYDIVGMWTEHLRSRSYLKIESREHIHNLVYTETLPNNAMLFVVFRMQSDEPFKIPQQHVYSKGASPEAVGAWKELR